MSEGRTGIVSTDTLRHFCAAPLRTVERDSLERNVRPIILALCDMIEDLGDEQPVHIVIHDWLDE